MLKSYYSGNTVEAGCDEAGRGCLAGPVFAAAVIFKQEFSHPLLNDSKKLSEKNRLILREIILSQAIAYAVEQVDNIKIDEINILNASFLAMNNAVKQLKVVPELLLIDGNRFRNSCAIPHVCIIKGDGEYASIAAASILAKTYRDEYMLEIHQMFPQYHWNKNKGYGTADHLQAIAEYGICEHHRKSFNMNPQLKLF